MKHFHMNRERWRILAGLLITGIIMYGLVPADIHWLCLGTPAWWTTPAGLIGVTIAVVLAPFYWPGDTRWILTRWRAAGAGDPVPKRGPDLPDPWWSTLLRVACWVVLFLLTPVYMMSVWLYGTDKVWTHCLPWLTLAVTIPAYMAMTARYLRRQSRLLREQLARTASERPWSITFGPEARMFVNGTEIQGRKITLRGGTRAGAEVQDRDRLLGLSDWKLDMTFPPDSDAAGVFDVWPLRSRDSQPPTDDDDGEKESGGR